MTATPQFSRTALLAIRFWDPVLSQPIDGLSVSARAYPSERPRIQAVRTPSGYYGFNGLPGMASVEQGLSSGPVRPFLIEIDDPAQRFIGVSFALDLPAATGPLYPPLPQGGEPSSGAAPGFLLFSSPLRRRGVGIACVRAGLVEKTGGAPAANAVLQVKLPDESLWYGLANARGEVVVMFPYPTFEVAPGDGDDPIPVPLSEQSWPLQISVLYNPDAQVYAPRASRPELSSLFQQPSGTLWEDSDALSGVPALELILRFDEELVMRTGTLPELWVQAGEIP